MQIFIENKNMTERQVMLKKKKVVIKVNDD